MDVFYRFHGTETKEDRLKQLVHTLYARRVPETSDTILVCGNREFCAHKVVLVASSKFFADLFMDGLNEEASNRITLKITSPEILEVILDYIYLGKVEKISEEKAKKVVVASRAMQIQDLFNYYCSFLESDVRLTNYFQLWSFAISYDIESLKMKVMSYLLSHFDEAKSAPEFLLLSLEQLKEFITFSKTQGVILDEILESMTNWLLHNLKFCEDAGKELLSCIDIKLLTEERTKSLLRNEAIMKSSAEVANRMNELGVALFLAHQCEAVSEPALVNSAGDTKTKTVPITDSIPEITAFLPKTGDTKTKTVPITDSMPEIPTVFLPKTFEDEILPVERVKTGRWLQLALSLASQRVVGSSDIILVCDNREFYAHKLVLETSTAYFESMFNSEMVEAKSGKIVFKEVEPETLEIILDYIYLGDVAKLQSEDIVKKVLVQAHLMQIKELFNYCCGALEVATSIENFFELWEIGLKYDQKDLVTKVMGFVSNRIDDTKDTSSFCLLTLDQIRELLKRHSESKVPSMNKMLQGLVNWLIHDASQREMAAGQLLAFIDIERVSSDCIKTIVGNAKVMKSSTEIANRINELSVAVLLFENSKLADQLREKTSNFEYLPLKTKYQPKCKCQEGFDFTSSRRVRVQRYNFGTDATVMNKSTNDTKVLA